MLNVLSVVLVRSLPRAPVEQVLLAALHVSPVEVLVESVVTLGGQSALSDLQQVDLPEVGVVHRDVGHVLEVEEPDGGLDVDSVECDGALLTPGLSEEHLNPGGSVRQSPLHLGVDDVGEDDVGLRLREFPVKYIGQLKNKLLLNLSSTVSLLIFSKLMSVSLAASVLRLARSSRRLMFWLGQELRMM